METVYYIYHIKGVKIGVAKNPKKRVAKQGYSEYEILEQHNCKYKVSDREIELQKQYGYEVDKAPYYISEKNIKYGRTKIDPNHIKLLGKIEGKKRVESGHLSKLHKEFEKTNHWSKIGTISANKRRKLTYDQAKDIRQYYSEKKYSQHQLAQMYKVSQGIITQIIRNLSYTKP
jgi:hypothetical protein